MKEPLPLRPEYAALTEQRRAGGGKDNPEAVCLPMGIMQFHTQGAPRKFVQTPDVLVILYEASMGLRQIFTDGREFPSDDPQPWWYGDPVGHWEGDTLVVVTQGLRDGEWLDIFGTPLTDAATYTERFRRVSYGRMEIDITVDDAKAYTAPWTVRVNQRIMPEQELLEFVCNENNRYFVRDLIRLIGSVTQGGAYATERRARVGGRSMRERSGGLDRTNRSLAVLALVAAAGCESRAPPAPAAAAPERDRQSRLAARWPGTIFKRVPRISRSCTRTVSAESCSSAITPARR